MRLLDKSSLQLDLAKLGFEKEEMEKFEKAIDQPYGMILITGPTGSGKSTTLYSVLSRLNTVNDNIVTVEEPVEYQVRGINQVQVHAEIGLTFAAGLRSILRQDPNVIMVGEIRDYETAELSLRAALTGHLLFTTIHTINAPSIIERLFEMGVPPFLIASSMLGAMSQRLVRKVCPHCSQKAAPPSEMVVNEFVKNMDPTEGKIVKELILKPGAAYHVEKGCPECRNTGYIGRTGIFELMIMNEEIRKQVLDHAPTDLIKRTAVQTGKMKTLLMDGILKARTGVTTLAEVIRVTATMV
jgi:type II secretory ATPase GspE/PulE/Tfp pilus assembly ATPase PilB-like protein